MRIEIYWSRKSYALTKFGLTVTALLTHGNEGSHIYIHRNYIWKSSANIAEIMADLMRNIKELLIRGELFERERGIWYEFENELKAIWMDI